MSDQEVDESHVEESDMNDDSEYHQSELEDHTQDDDDSASPSESDFLPSELDEEPIRKRKGRKPRLPVSLTKPVNSTTTTDGIATTEAAAASSASSSLLPASSPASMRFASTGETAQGTLFQLSNHHSAATAIASRPTTPSRVKLSRSVTDGAISSSGALVTSTSSSGTSKNVCDFPGCNKSFSKVGKLNRHKLSHTGVKSFICTHPGCGKQFTRNDRLRRHWKIHQNEAQGGTSSAKKRKKSFSGELSMNLASAAATSSTQSDASKEMDQHLAVEDSHADFMSGSDFEPIPDAILTTSAAGSSTTSSLLLTTTNPTSTTLTPPTAATLPPELPPLVKFPCTYPGCTFSFLLREHLKRHESVHVALPGSTPSTPGVVQKRIYACTHLGCFLTFDKAHKLREHAFVHTGILPWICSLPLPQPQPDENEDEEDEDEEMEEADQQHQQSPPTVPSTTSIAAAAADTTSSSATPNVATSALTASSTTLATPPATILCQEGFMTRAHLLKHQRLHHTPGRFLCGHPGCHEQFTRFLDLRKHRTVAHGGADAKWLTCDVCGMRMAKKAEAEAHAQTHLTPEEREQYLLPCPFSGPPHSCTKKFTRKGNLNMHIRSTHDGTWKGTMPPPSSAAGQAAAAALESDQTQFGPLVIRYPCPFPQCQDRMAHKPYKLKCTLQRHLVKGHAMTPAESKDPLAIERAVRERGDVPLPPHPNTLRKLSSRAQVTGVKRSRSSSNKPSSSSSLLKEVEDEKESGEESQAMKDEEKSDVTRPTSFLAQVFQDRVDDETKEPELKRPKLMPTDDTTTADGTITDEAQKVIGSDSTPNSLPIDATMTC